MVRTSPPSDRELLAAYRSLWKRIVAFEQRAIDDPRRYARASDLARFRVDVETRLRALDRNASRWIRTNLRATFESHLGRVMDAADRRVFEEYARVAQRSLLSSSKHVSRDVKRFITQAGRLRSLSVASGQQSQRAAAKLMARDMRDHGIAAVTYRNGARHGLDEYASMVIRTVSSQATNAATLRGSDVQFFEVFDGPGCGWTAHGSGEMANGKIVTYDDAMANIIAHPNCQRRFVPRPDLREVKAGDPNSGRTAYARAIAQRRAMLARARARRRVRTR